MPTPRSPDSVLQNTVLPRSREKEPWKRSLPPLALIDAAQKVLHSMRDLIEILVEAHYAHDLMTATSKDSARALLDEALHLAQQTLDTQVQEQILVLIRDLDNPTLSPQKRKLRGTPVYDPTTFVGTHPINQSTRYYNPRYEPTAAELFNMKVASERAAREQQQEEEAMTKSRAQQARLVMADAMRTWQGLGGQGMRHVHDVMAFAELPAHSDSATFSPGRAPDSALERSVRFEASTGTGQQTRHRSAIETMPQPPTPESLDLGPSQPLPPSQVPFRSLEYGDWSPLSKAKPPSPTHNARGGSNASDPTGETVELPRFVPAKRFEGARRRYVFKAGGHGLGYYLDQPPPFAWWFHRPEAVDPVTAQLLARLEELEKTEAAAAQRGPKKLTHA